MTLSGEMEPTAYITETFAGDGTTTVFQLVGGAVSPKKTANSAKLLTDSFNEGAFDQTDLAGDRSRVRILD